MMKFLLILLLIPVVIVFGLYFMMKRAKKVFFTNLNRQMNAGQGFPKEREDKYAGKDVLYRKNNITVLKGEAKDND